MSYFSRRNSHVVEFSGYEEVSVALRQRLYAILKLYVGKNQISYGSDKPWYIELNNFYYEVQKEFPSKSPFDIINNEVFHEVFTVVEIFLDMVRHIYYARSEQAPYEVLQSFQLSGSVYTINNGRIELIIDENLAKQIEQTKAVLLNFESSYNRFFDAVGNLVGRKAKAEDIIKDVFIAFEDYLKNKTNSNDFGSSVISLEKRNTISSTQKALLDKIYAYRSDTHGVGHAGNAKMPQEIDALWFVETVIAQLQLINRKLKQDKTNT